MTQSEKLDYVKELFLATDSLYTCLSFPAAFGVLLR